jgi:hypothetical protein
LAGITYLVFMLISYKRHIERGERNSRGQTGPGLAMISEDDNMGAELSVAAISSRLPDDDPAGAATDQNQG